MTSNLNYLILWSLAGFGCLEPKGEENLRQQAATSTQGRDETATDDAGKAEENKSEGAGKAKPIETGAAEVVLTFKSYPLPQTSHADLLWINGESKVQVLDISKGEYSEFDRSNGTLSPPQQTEESGAYEKLLFFGSEGWIALHKSNIRIFLSKVSEYADAKLPSTEVEILASEPGFLALKSGEKFSAISYQAGELKSVSFKLPLPPTAFGKCRSGCSYWMVAGNRLFFAQNKDGQLQWQRAKVNLTVPENKALTRIFLIVEADDGGHPVVKDAIALAESQIYLLASSTSAEEVAFGTPDLLKVSAAFCMPCHKDDGYDKLTTWTSLKTDIIQRLSSGSMPPSESDYGKKISMDDKKKVIAYLEKLQATEGIKGSASQNGDSETKPLPAPLADAAKAAGCLAAACHPSASKLDFWQSKSANIIERVGSGNMPKGKTLNANEKKVLIDLVKGLVP